MKKVKRLLSVMLAVVMVVAMALPAMATESKSEVRVMSPVSRSQLKLKRNILL